MSYTFSHPLFNLLAKNNPSERHVIPWWEIHTLCAHTRFLVAGTRERIVSTTIQSMLPKCLSFLSAFFWLPQGCWDAVTGLFPTFLKATRSFFFPWSNQNLFWKVHCSNVPSFVSTMEGNRKPTVQIITWFLLVVSAFAVVIRLLVKKTVTKAVSLDDMFVGLALVSNQPSRGRIIPNLWHVPSYSLSAQVLASHTLQITVLAKTSHYCLKHR